MLRNRVEDVLRGWRAYEARRPSAVEVIDFDCRSGAGSSVTIKSRFHAYRLLRELRGTSTSEICVLQRLDADLAYLAALMGQFFTLDEYLARTQGCRAAGWPASYVEERGDVARESLAQLGIPWGNGTLGHMDELEGLLADEEAADVIRSAAHDLEPAVRAAAKTDVHFPLVIENVHVDEYWEYWLDGNRDQVRLRLNLNKAKFTKTQARQMALHEILGHGLQFTTLAETSRSTDVPWVRLFSVHAPTQVLFEGLAQALPLLVTPDDTDVVARVRLLHYLQLVRAELHLAINAGASIDSCVKHAQRRVPFWEEDQIARLLVDRSNSTLLRSYLWAYPAGCDWFVSLIDSDRDLALALMRATYRSPFTPGQLAAAWPDGPPIGGPGGAIVLR
jgi:hypothetical protein